MKPLCVIGSLNVDLTVTLPRFHGPGETITGSDFRTYAGGKGGNQAVAAARLGAQTYFIGKLGDDGNGSFYRSILLGEGVDIAGVATISGVPSGVALIEVNPQGENRIAVIPGTNGLVDEKHIDASLQAVPQGALLLMQLEITLKSVLHAAQAVRQRGGVVILDPAPAVPLPGELLALVDWLTPNEHELRLLTNMPTSTREEAEAAARALLRRGVKAVVAKLGSRGCLCVTQEAAQFVPGFRVQVVDTTAAGDSFNAGLGVALALGMQRTQMLRFANAVGALSVTGAGAQAAMPRMAQALQLMAEQP